jgi:hypothetical protein
VIHDDTSALQRSDMMLRDQHYRINTTSFRHRKLSPYQQRADTGGYYVLQGHLVTSLEIFFHDVGDTHALFRLRSLMPQPAAALARCRGERYQ